MSVLLLRLSGPMQSWGVQSRFSVRDTGLEPSKSGVIGLLCAALGLRRDEPLAGLAAMRMGVRVDQEGSLLRDFHTTKRVLESSGTIKETETSSRYYLAGARFLVGLESADLALLCRLHAALRDPHWPLYLGRKAFVPGEPAWLAGGLRPGDTLRHALERFPWLGRGPCEPPAQLRLVMEDHEGQDVRPDQPVSFAQRRFVPRRVRTEFVPTPQGEEADPCTSPG